jgi:hypothetical protein
VVSFKFGNHKSNVKSVERRGIKIKKNRSAELKFTNRYPRTGFFWRGRGICFLLMKRDQREKKVLLQDM